MIVEIEGWLVEETELVIEADFLLQSILFHSLHFHDLHPLEMSRPGQLFFSSPKKLFH